MSTSRDYYGPGCDQSNAPLSDPEINRAVNWYWLAPASPGIAPLMEWMRRTWHDHNVAPYTPYNKRD